MCDHNAVNFVHDAADLHSSSILLASEGLPFCRHRYHQYYISCLGHSCFALELVASSNQYSTAYVGPTQQPVTQGSSCSSLPASRCKACFTVKQQYSVVIGSVVIGDGYVTFLVVPSIPATQFGLGACPSVEHASKASCIQTGHSCLQEVTRLVYTLI